MILLQVLDFLISSHLAKEVLGEDGALMNRLLDGMLGNFSSEYMT